MIGQEIVASFHLQSQLHHLAGLENGQIPIPPPAINGFLPNFLPPGFPGQQLPRLPPPPFLPPVSPAVSTPGSQPSLPGLPSLSHDPPATPGVDSPLERIHSIAKSESANAQSLDTADVAQRVRELLSANNIGQRLFAKHVLGLSQGTVSELLSKPKHWDKLTEKGRESYRKMALWAGEEKNVLELKAISPKKGEFFPNLVMFWLKSIAVNKEPSWKK